MNTSSNNKPLLSLRDGGISIAVFDGQYGKSVVLQKSYLPKGGDASKKEDWKRSQINLFLNELPKVKTVVDEAVNKLADEIKANERRLA